jgi:G protein beta subunit-like protein
MEDMYMIDCSASSDHVARLWELATGETVRHYNGHHKGLSVAVVVASAKPSPACVCCALHDLPGVERE